MAADASSDDWIDWLETSDLTHMYQDWNYKKYGTWHPVFIPPALRFQSLDEAHAWAARTIAVLTTATPELGGKCPLDCPDGFSAQSHLVLVQGTEFMFNKRTTGDGPADWKADASQPVDFEFFSAAIKDVHDAIKDVRFQDCRIVLALSSVVDYGPLPGVVNPAGQPMRLAENAAFVMNNESDGFQKISKIEASNLDNWDRSRYYDYNENRKVPSVTDPARIREHTHSIRDFGADGKGIAIGFGLCKDSSWAEFPGTSVMVFLGGDMKRSTVHDQSLGGFCVGDTGNFRTARKPNPGEYTFSPTIRLSEARQNEAEYARLRTYNDALKASGRFNDPASVKWLNNPRVIAPTPLQASMFHDVVGVSWPMDIKEAAVFYRRQDYTEIGESIVCGIPRPLPKKPMSLGGDAVLAPMQMHQFVDEEQFEAVKAILETEAARQDLKEYTPKDIYELYDSALKEARSEGRELGGWEWIKRVSDNVRDKARGPVEFRDHDFGAGEGGGGAADPVVDPVEGGHGVADPGREDEARRREEERRREERVEEASREGERHRGEHHY